MRNVADDAMHIVSDDETIVESDASCASPGPYGLQLPLNTLTPVDSIPPVVNVGERTSGSQTVEEKKDNGQSVKDTGSGGSHFTSETSEVATSSVHTVSAVVPSCTLVAASSSLSASCQETDLIEKPLNIFKPTVDGENGLVVEVSENHALFSRQS